MSEYAMSRVCSAVLAIRQGRSFTWDGTECETGSFGLRPI